MSVSEAAPVMEPFNEHPACRRPADCRAVYSDLCQACTVLRAHRQRKSQASTARVRSIEAMQLRLDELRFERWLDAEHAKVLATILAETVAARAALTLRMAASDREIVRLSTQVLAATSAATLPPAATKARA